MAHNFGRTWWGQQWLAAFDGIDHSNRLPRGRRYANNGSVRSIHIDNGATSARVKGSRSAPYKVHIALPAFSDAEQRTVLDTVKADPVLLSRLLNRQLPPQVSSRLETQRIWLFPRSWRDLKAKCSCPDGALPCKHIAAVIYLIANEIDKDPFLVFTLHGLDLVDRLTAQMALAPATLSTLPVLSQGWSTTPSNTDNQPPSIEALGAIDWSHIPPLESRIFTILSAEPLFHDKDFRQILAAQYQRTRRAARRFNQATTTVWQKFEKLTDLTAIIDDSGQLIEMRASNRQGGEVVRHSHPPSALQDLLAGLHLLPAEREPRLSPGVALWRILLRCALGLIEQGAFIPMVATNVREETIIVWQPARLAEPVETLFEQLCALCPSALVQQRANPQGGGKNDACAEAATQITAALNLLLGLFIRIGFHSNAESRRDDPVQQLFFNARPLRFETFETRRTPQLIAHWLRRLTLGERAHRLSLMVEEADDDRLAVTLAVEHQGGYQPIASWLAADENRLARADVLADLAVLADYFPDVEELYAGQHGAAAGNRELRFTLATFTPIIRDVLPALRMLGINVMLPRALQQLARPRASLSLSASDSDSAVSYLNLEQLLAFDWQVAIGDQHVSIDEFRQLVDNATGLVRIRDRYVMIDAGEVRQLLDRLETPPAQLSRVELLQAGLSGELDDAEVTTNRDARALFDQLIRPQSPPPLPTTLTARLRPYQQRGFEWLADNARLGFGALLADDMGLGKTLQLIALLAHLKATQRLASGALIVVPTPLLTNWRHEFERFAADLTVQVYHGPERQLARHDHDVILTSYGLARTDAGKLAKPVWTLVAIDEAQNIKNPASAQAKAVKRLKAYTRIALSGTPVENRLREYWSVFDFINPGYLGTQKRFARTFATPIERDRDQATLDRFRAITAPFILRRLKSDTSIIADLPDKIEANRYCTLSAEQASLYQSSVETIMASLASSEDGIERRGIIFKLLNALKQICNSPAQFAGRKTADVEGSGKLAALIGIMREVDAADEKALIFTQYTTMGELLGTALRDELDLEAPFLHGGLTRKQRDDMVEAFQGDAGPRALIVSLKAGGTGLNLTAASQVIHYDLWWNPAVEAQATDRAYRIGQRRNVTVHRLITENTFEEKIDAMIRSKRELADLTVASGEQWISELSDSELRDLVAYQP
ncbi:SNF2-related protein [Kushneria aurantia]|uniref:SNF2-related protein n=1 Tax=Kushneria aurantia TaxID=504092 RepID=A0ABV6G7W5_9GAMM|nr:SNF2-related protein [Kushneria aurantia]